MHLLHLCDLTLSDRLFLNELRVKDFDLGDLAKCLLSLPVANVSLIVVEGEIVEHEHLLGAVSGNEASE